MKPTTQNIERLYNVIQNSLFMITGKLDYDRITDAIIELANACHAFESESKDYDAIWYLGESGHCDLASFIVGAYWHFTEWHSGQWSKGYAALSALDEVYSPGMTDGPEPDSSELYAYQALGSMAEKVAA